IVFLGMRIIQLATLDVKLPASEEVIATTVVIVQMCVDYNVNTFEIELLFVEGGKLWIHISNCWMQLSKAGIDQHTRIGMVDYVYIDWHAFIFNKQLGNEDWCDSNFHFSALGLGLFMGILLQEILEHM